MNGESEKTYSAAWERIRNTKDRCKHEIAVMMYQEQRADQEAYNDALCEKHEAEQAASDDSLSHYDPEVDFPY